MIIHLTLPKTFSIFFAGPFACQPLSSFVDNSLGQHLSPTAVASAVLCPTSLESLNQHSLVEPESVVRPDISTSIQKQNIDHHSLCLSPKYFDHQPALSLLMIEDSRDDLEAVMSHLFGKFSFLMHSSKQDDSHLPSKSSLESSIISNEKKEQLIQNILDDQSIKSDDQYSVSESSTDIRTNSGFSDLDILPTKDYCTGGLFVRQGSMSSCSHYSDSKLSSESFSPMHDSRALHSDSEVTPKKV
ncbi:uncharacterized protein CEXT_141841 [Caerostris extrusa]|uniref:Uncharacterized protein n=1 Tax=Caerostris extrusa TaxID=172846 RepID=A0AAV4X9Z9_CAEEX|nr:uncharacterized protein CEXT_141841 [Caerostris extrusa]